MEKIIQFEVEEKDGSIIQWVKIDKGDDEAIWMPKAIYDEQQALNEAKTI